MPEILIKTLSILSISAISAFGQIVPDGTLPQSSTVTLEGNTYTLEGGTEAGNNLFHSFEEFSLPTGSEAFFDNANRIENILTRVTGNEISNIDGLLRANGTANLFLINPNGIVFGPNARLDIGGSFFASTAESIQFSNGSVFTTSEPETTPMLTVSVPVGLQYGRTPGEIRVRGTGHRLTREGATFLSASFFPSDRTQSEEGLRVRPGRTLALLGGNLVLEGATVTAEAGRIELGAVGGLSDSNSPENTASVSLTPVAEGWALGYENIGDFADIKLSQQALVDASGTMETGEVLPLPGGSIQVRGRNFEGADGSIVLVQSFGVDPSGSIDIATSESITGQGLTADGNLRGGISSEALGPGRGADVTLSTRRLTLDRGASVSVRTFGVGEGGNLRVNASESISLGAPEPTYPQQTVLVNTLTVGAGDGGNTTVATGRLTLCCGATISSSTFGVGDGGNLRLFAEDIELIGVAPLTFSPSILAALALNAGDAGSLTVDSQTLTLLAGGRIAASTAGSGAAGSVVVNASEFVEVSGTVPGSVNPSLIDSSANIPDESLQQLFGIPAFPSGSSGDLTVRTPLLRVSDGAQVTVRNDGSGNAGSLVVSAGSIELDHGDLTASTQSGEGGNVVLQLENSLQLRRGSEISAEAGGTGNGGNIAIETATLAVLDGSRVTANAFEGVGGNITIDTQGLFLSPESQITASSRLGGDGIVEVLTPTLDTSTAMVALDSEPIDLATQVVSACAAMAEGNTFVVTGNGGLPEDPTQILRHPTVWVDMRLMEIDDTDSEATEFEMPSEKSSVSLVEATRWQRRDNGTVELLAGSEGAIDRWTPRRCIVRP